MANPQDEAPQGTRLNTSASGANGDVEARLAALEVAVESLAAEGIKARLESPDLLAELIADYGLDDLARRIATVESVINTWEGSEKPDVMMRLRDIEMQITALNRKIDDTILTVARGLADLRAVMRNLATRLSETNGSHEEEE